MAEIRRDDFVVAPPAEAAVPAGSERASFDAVGRGLTARRRPAQSTLSVVPGTRDVIPAEQHAANGIEADLGSRLALLELQLREQLEIERMRDLELGRLEHELEQKSDRLQKAETGLFHERRRSAELERRWNVLAASYEETAASLVETGAILAAIQTQTSYRAIVAILKLVRRNHGTDSAVEKIGLRLRRSDAG